MQLRARKGLPFCVDCVVKNIPPTPVAQNITGARVGWFGDSFTTEVLTLDATTGRLRFRATSAYVNSLPARVYATSVYLRINDVTHVFPMAVVVTEKEVILSTPDPGHHQGALGYADGNVYRLEFSSGELTSGGVGADGDDGWSPVFAVVTDGARRVLQVTSWVGGTGTPPASGDYVGPTGFVGSAAAAVDIRGSVGPAGADGVGSTPDAFQTVNFGGTALVADSPTDTLNVTAGTGIGLSGNAGTDTATITNTGVTSIAAGLGMSFNAATGGVTATNTGVRTLTAGSGVSLGGTAQDRTISAAVTSVNGSVGAVATPNAFTSFIFGGVTLLPDILQDTLTFTLGAGLSFSVTVGTDSVAIANTGVLSVNGNTGVVVTPNAFSTVMVGATALVADSTSDTLNLTPGPGISLGANAGTDTVSISSLGPIKSYTSVLASNVSTATLAGILLPDQSIIVAPDCTVSIDVTLLYSLANAAHGLALGFYLQQGGSSGGPDVSYGNYSIDSYNQPTWYYDNEDAVRFRSGYLGVASGANANFAIAQNSTTQSSTGTVKARCTIRNGGTANLQVSMSMFCVTNGQTVTALKGSSFEAHIVNT